MEVREFVFERCIPDTAISEEAKSPLRDTRALSRLSAFPNISVLPMEKQRPKHSTKLNASGYLMFEFGEEIYDVVVACGATISSTSARKPGTVASDEEVVDLSRLETFILSGLCQDVLEG